MHASSIAIMTRMRRHFGKLTSILDVGSRDVNGTYRPLFVGWEYVGLDIFHGPNVDIVVADPYDWRELQGRQFDAVISGQCLEHCSAPWLTAQQMLRHCKPGGYIAAIAPFRQSPHGYPHDYFRFTGDGLAALFGHQIDVIDKGISQGTKTIVDARLLARKPHVT